MLPRIRPTSIDGHSHRWLALTGIVLASFVGTWDGTAPVVIIPAIMKQYNVGVDTAGLFLTVGLMFFAVPMAATGKLGDVWGHKRLYLISSVASSLMAGMVVFAPSFGLLITFRALQGISSTPTYTATLAYIAKVFPVHERGRAMGIMGMTASLAWAIGPAMGGFLTDTFGWRAVILVEIPLSLIAFLAAFILMPPDQDVRRSSFDVKGMISFTLIALIMMLASRWVGERTFEPLVVVVIIISLIFLIIFFLRTERHQKEPFIPLSMFFEKRFTLATAFSSLQMAANFSIALLASIYLQVVRGYSAGEAGLIVAGVSIARVFLDPLAGRISELWGVRAPSIIGTTLYSFILLLIMFGHPTPAPDWLMFVIMFVLGVGVSMSRTPVNMGVTTILREKDMGLGLGVFSMLTYLGGAFGQAISGSLLRIASKAGNQPLEWIQQSVLQKSFTITFGALFAIGILAWFISFGLPSKSDVVYADG